MSIRLGDDDRRYLERFLGRAARPTRRQKARALLALDEGKDPSEVAKLVGIDGDSLSTLADQFGRAGLAGIGLKTTRHPVSVAPQHAGVLAIKKTRGVCGGAARVAGTRIPIWQLVEARDMGATEAQLLLDYPALTARALVAAWTYAEDHPEEIASEILTNEVA